MQAGGMDMITFLRVLTVILTAISVIFATVLFYTVGWHSLVLLSGGAMLIK
jgi:hypothetical protein